VVRLSGASPKPFGSGYFLSAALAKSLSGAMWESIERDSTDTNKILLVRTLLVRPF
jgi:hypothetical protein